MQMQIKMVSQQSGEVATAAVDRPNPSRFIASVAIGLFAVTVFSVLTMHLAVVFNWQI